MRESYFLVLKVSPFTNKAMLATIHSNELAKRPKGISHSPGAKARGMINPVSSPAVTTKLINSPPPARYTAHQK